MRWPWSKQPVESPIVPLSSSINNHDRTRDYIKTVMARRGSIFGDLVKGLDEDGYGVIALRIDGEDANFEVCVYSPVFTMISLGTKCQARWIPEVGGFHIWGLGVIENPNRLAAK